MKVNVIRILYMLPFFSFYTCTRDFNICVTLCCQFYSSKTHSFPLPVLLMLWCCMFLFVRLIHIVISDQRYFNIVCCCSDICFTRSAYCYYQRKSNSNVLSLDIKNTTYSIFLLKFCGSVCCARASIFLPWSLNLFVAVRIIAFPL